MKKLCVHEKSLEYINLENNRITMLNQGKPTNHSVFLPSMQKLHGSFHGHEAFKFLKVNKNHPSQ